MRALRYPTYLIRVMDSTREHTYLHAHDRADELLKYAYEQEAVGSGLIAFGKRASGQREYGWSAVVVTAQELACAKHHSGKPPKVIKPSTFSTYEKALKRLRELGYDGREPAAIYAWSDLVLITIWPGKDVGLIVAAVDGKLMGEHGRLKGVEYTAKTANECYAELEEGAEAAKVF